jgi:L-iditol 2-dehydrogenase
MKALIHNAPYSLEYVDFPDPVVGDDDVLIRVKACGICGSDIQGFTGKTGRRIPPIIMGHEAAGIVEATGRSVGFFKKGDRVTFDSTVYCNECGPCRNGLYNRCERREVLGVSIPQFRRHGAFAEYVAVPWWIVAGIPDNLSFTYAALLEPVSIAMHAANRVCISANATVAVIGAGTIGLFVIQAARLKGAARVIACDINNFRLDVAKILGANITINPTRSDPIQEIQRQTKNKGVEVSFEAVGCAETFRNAMAITKTGGHIVAIGNVTKMVEFNMQELVARELTVTGSYASSGEFRDCIDLVASGKISVKPLISDILPLHDGPRAFGRLLNGEEDLLKIILEP